MNLPQKLKKSKLEDQHKVLINKRDDNKKHLHKIQVKIPPRMKIERFSIDIPFFPQKTNSDCGPTTLQMVLAYFGQFPSLEEIKKEMKLKNEIAVNTSQIAIASSSFGHETTLYTKSVLPNQEFKDEEFYKKFSEEYFNESSKYIEFAKNIGVQIIEKTLTHDELLNLLTKDSVLIILLDWNVIIDNRGVGYQGHFVPIIGFDDESVYVHDPGTSNPSPDVKIPKEIFEKARKAKGTDEDVVVVYR